MTIMPNKSFDEATYAIVQAAVDRTREYYLQRAKRVSVLVSGTEVYVDITKKEARKLMSALGRGNFTADFRSADSTLYIEAKEQPTMQPIPNYTTTEALHIAVEMLQAIALGKNFPAFEYHTKLMALNKARTAAMIAEDKVCFENRNDLLSALAPLLYKADNSMADELNCRISEDDRMGLHALYGQIVERNDGNSPDLFLR